MTKKSQARVKRDQEKKDLEKNTCWDDLNEINSTIKCMVAQHALISGLASNQALVANLEDPKNVASKIRILSKDLIDLNNRIIVLESEHKDKQGGAKDINDMVKTLEIGQEYAFLIELHDAVIHPTAVEICESFDAAEKKVIQFQQAEEQVTSPEATQTQQ